MNSIYNPFITNRTEQMNELWKYYVPFIKMGAEGKPLLVEGGRGSGKTMLFQCNSWKQKLERYKKDNDNMQSFISDMDFVGIYYRVDTTFVSSMRGRGEHDWESIFNTYISACILKEICLFLKEVESGVIVEKSMEISFVQKYAKRIIKSDNYHSVDDLYVLCDEYLDYIEDIINGEMRQRDFRNVNAKRFIDDVCIDCGKLLNREGLVFKILIDEYETLQEYQQKIVNTLIKHSALPIVYNIGMRPKGMKTPKTISDTEIIESPHDYAYCVLGVDKADYTDLIKEICKKRIQFGKNVGTIPESASDDIEYYLGLYDIDEELFRLNGSKAQRVYLKELRKIIIRNAKEEGNDESQISEYVKALCEDAPLLNSRMHLALLCKKTAYTPKIQELYDEYVSNSNRYKEWIHSRKNGVIYLLCKEFKRKKMYYGFDVYCALSSNIVRYFLELCERAFTNAFLNGFKWDRTISFDEQGDAARYVSEYKIYDIACYEPYGNKLRIFIEYLGKIFNYLHVMNNNSLGEPEPNHFNTKNLSLSEDTKKMINSAVMWNVLQEGEPTKRKKSISSPETVDYYLNKIYVPYFGISYRNQRKISLTPEVLEKLLSGDEPMANEGYKLFFKDQTNADDNNQMSLFDDTWGEIDDSRRV